MNANLQSRIKPPVPQNKGVDFSNAKVSSLATKDAVDSTDVDKTDFRDLLMNSNSEVAMERLARKNGDLSGAKSDEEFFNMLKENLNKPNSRTPKNQLDKDSFLKLFITQIQSQDPLSPKDSSEMAAQLAQFHSLEQMMNMNKGLEKLTGEQQLSRAVSLVDFVGKEINMDNGKLFLKGNELTDASMLLHTDSVKTTLEVRSPAGNLIAQKDLGPMKGGEHKVVWDGLDKEGKHVSDGAYTFSIRAQDIHGAEIPTSIESRLKISGVDLKDKGGTFYTEIGKVKVDEILSIGDKNFMAPANSGASPEAPNAAPAGSNTQSGDQQHSQNESDQPPAEVVPTAAAIQQGSTTVANNVSSATTMPQNPSAPKESEETTMPDPLAQGIHLPASTQMPFSGPTS